MPPDNATSQPDVATNPDFGIIIACCDQDLLFAKGCCASIRYFCGDIPICLIVNGDFSVDILKKTYGVRAIYPKNVPDERLRRQSFGFGLTKMIALWHSPFERFLFLDADTVMWGDVPSFIGAFKDAVIDRHIGGHTDADIDSFYFRIKPFEKAYPNINWRRHQADYFCSGVFAFRRSLLDVDEYLEWLEVMWGNPQLIKPGDQTLLNLMLFQAADRGEIDLRQEKIQLVTHGVGREGLQKLFPLKDGIPDVTGPAIVIHWAGAKPLRTNKNVYPKPMLFFRRKFLKDAYNLTERFADVVIAFEELHHRFLINKNRATRLIKRVTH
jgi:hypothetical protein